MRQTFRHFLVASTLAFTGSAGAFASGQALAQAGDLGAAEPKQVALTQKMIDGLIASQPAIAAAEAKAKPNSTGDIDPKVTAAVTAAAKKSGFASLDAFESASDSVGVVMAGIDPSTKSYVGPSAVIKRQLAQVQADPSMTPKDKAEAVKAMKEALAAGDTVVPIPANIDLVIKNYDKLSQLLQGAAD